MNKLLLAVLFAAASTTAFADSYRGSKHGHKQIHNRGHGHVYGSHHHHRGGRWERRHNDWVWVVPAIVGGIIVYEATRPQTVIIERTESEPNCSPWTEIQNPDGTITRTRTCKR